MQRHPLNAVHRARPLVLALLVVAVLGPLAAAQKAPAQGTSGMLPDPITGRELSAYARRLSLSEQQRLAVDSYHEQYLREFRLLREREIDQFLEESGGRMRGFMFSPDTREVRDSLTELDRLMKRIRTLDEGLFDRIQGVLSEEQTPAMPRVRQMRERARHGTGQARMMSFSNPAARVDLADLLERIDLSPQDRQAVDPLAVQYEQQLTTSVKKLYEESRTVFLDMAKRVEELAGGGGQFDRRVMRSFREIWQEATKDVTAQAASIADLNRRSHRGFTQVLSEDAGERLTAGYYERAYPDVLRGAMTSLGRYDAALRLPGLSEQRLAMIRTAREELKGRHQRLAEQMIDVIDEQRKSFSMFGPGGRSQDPLQQKLTGLRQKRDELNEQAIASLMSMLGPELAEQLADAPDSAAGPAGAVSAVIVAPDGGGPHGGFGRMRQLAVRIDEEDNAGGPDDRPDPYLPGPISRDELGSYARLLRLAEDHLILLESLYADYLESFDELRQEHIEPILAAGRNMWSLDSESGEIKAPSADDIDRLFAQRQIALEAILRLDGAFFGDVELAVLDGQDDARRALMPRVRAARQRIVYRRSERSGGMGFFGGRGGPGGRMRFSMPGRGGAESAIDLVRLVEERDFGPTEMDALDPALAEYERTFAGALKQRYEAAFENDRAMERISAAAAGQRRDREGRRGRGGDFGTEFRRMRESLGPRLAEADQAIVDLNRRAVEELAAALPSSAGQAVRTAYRRLAHADVYDDPRAVEPHFRRSLVLEDLTDRQRTEISDLLAEYREPYAALCREMVDLEIASATARQQGPGEGGWERIRENRSEMEKLRFDRNELNDKTLRRLRAVLTEAQIAALGLGPGE